MKSQNRILIISKSIEHFSKVPEQEIIKSNLYWTGIMMRIDANRKLTGLGNQIDNRITLRSAMFWLKQQRLQIEVLGKIITK